MKYRIWGCLLCFLAVVKVVSDVAGLEKLSAVAATTNLTPAMKVFTAHKGYETYSSKFELVVDFRDGEQVTSVLDLFNYSGLRGPYNRRNVYGALIAYGPVLVSNPRTVETWREMARRGFCRENTVLYELAFENLSGVAGANINYHGQVKNADRFPAQLEVVCD